MEEPNMAKETSGKKLKKGRAKQPRNNKDLETKIRRRVALEEKAFRVVERLVDETIDEDTLKTLAQQIDPSHYADITEERFIANLCGYPVCSKQLGKFLSQKYQISTKTNKVYDITERKKFCSNQCYKASHHFASQISSSPVWLREDEEPVNFKILPLDVTNKGSAGEDVIVTSTQQLSRELQELDKIDQRNERSYKKLQTILKGKQDVAPTQEENVTVETLADQLTKVYVNLTETGNKEKEAKPPEEKSDNTQSNSTPVSDPLTVSSKTTKDCTAPLTVQDDNCAATSTVCIHDGIITTELENEGQNVGAENLKDALSENTDGNVKRDILTERGPTENSETSKHRELPNDNCLEENRNSKNDTNEAAMDIEQYSRDFESGKHVYGLSHVHEINKTELSKEILRRDISSQNGSSDRWSGVSKTSPKCRDYNFDYQPRDHVYGFDHEQQILKMGANKELLLNELHQRYYDSNSNSNLPNKEVVVENMDGQLKRRNEANNSAVQTVAKTAQDKGSLLLQLINKRDELKRQELNSKQNEKYETEKVVSKNRNSNSRRDGILQSVRRASEQKRAFHSDQSKPSVSDSDDDGDDVTEVRLNQNTELSIKQTSLTSENVIPKIQRYSEQDKSNSEAPTSEKQATNVQAEFKETVKQKTNLKQQSVKPKISPLILVQNILYDWKTTDSIKYLKSENDPTKPLDFEERYTELGRRLDRKTGEASDLLGEIDSDDDMETPVGKLPDMCMLQQQNTGYELKVREFYVANNTGSEPEQPNHIEQASEDTTSDVVKPESPRQAPEENAKSRRFRKKFFPMKEETEGKFNRTEFVTEREIVLPYVDSSSQMSIRRKIVLEKLSKILPGLISPLRLTLNEISPHVRALVHTFHLTSTNVNMKPAEWIIVCLLLLKILACKVKEIENSFELHSARTYFDTLTQRIGVTEGQLSYTVKKFIR